MGARDLNLRPTDYLCGEPGHGHEPPDWLLKSEPHVHTDSRKPTY